MAIPDYDTLRFPVVPDIAPDATDKQRAETYATISLAYHQAISTVTRELRASRLQNAQLADRVASLESRIDDLCRLLTGRPIAIGPQGEGT